MKKLILLLVISLMLPFGGCGKGKAPVKKPEAGKVSPAEVKGAKTETEEIKKVAQEEYKYDSKGRRDPFLSLVEITKDKPMKRKGASPIESYDLDEIKLLAIAWDENKHYALIMLPDRKAYTITVGMTLGMHGGKVQQITRDTVVIREFVRDYRGDIKPRDSILKLHKGEE
jgi:Tfp pilus assembly protein PilP